MIEALTLLLVLGATAAVTSNNFVEKCLGLKLAGDSLGVLVLAYGTQMDNGDVRGLSLAILALTTGFIFLLLVVGRRQLAKK